MSDSELFLGILLVAAAAFIGGAIAQALRLPTIAGFLAAGVAIAPSTPGPVGDVDAVGNAADIGVIFLMFSIGIQFSFSQLAEYRALILKGGIIQIGLTLGLGLAVGQLLGFGLAESLIIGFLASNTSTVVSSKILEGRQELKTVHGVASVNISILQDLSAVLMVIAVPSLGGERFDIAEFVFAIGKGAALIAIAYLVSIYLLPQIWRRVAQARSRELSLLAAITLAIGLATGSGFLGLSVAFGAFLAGLALSENEYGHATLADIIPLRELFASIFFVSMGMLVDPDVLSDNPTNVIALTLLIIVGKGLLSIFAVRVAGLTLGSAVLTGLVLAQVGEFSFVIARTGLEEGVITDDLASAFLLAAVLSILLNPLLVRLGPAAVSVYRSLPLLGKALDEPATFAQTPEGTLNRHVIICGYGDTAAALVRSLHGRNFPLVVIDNNPFTLDRVRRTEPSLPFIYGDATRPETLDLAGIGLARAVAITFANPAEAQMAAQNARIANQRVDVVARGSSDTHQRLRQAGSNEVVDPEFEASLEFVRHVLHRFGVDSREITALQTRWRAEHYHVQ